MLERKIYNDLLDWKNSDDKMCLIVKGARQVGKTYIIEKFCKENYENYIKIDFYEKPEYKQIFEGNLDIDTIIKKISAMIPNANISNPNTILFLDEIQNCLNAITALKFLTIAKKFDVIASGSLLGLTYKEETKKYPNFSYPVGYVKHLDMHSLDFEEFCWANGVGKDTFDYLEELFNKKEQVPDAIHIRMLNLFKEYIIVGGMPKAVSTFIETSDFGNVLKIQQDILEEYKNDITKYAKGTEKTKVRECFLSISKHLAQDYKKFRYGLVKNNGKAETYAGSLMWLYDANITNFCYNLSKPEDPLEGNASSDIFKVYMRDTGLLMAMLETGSQAEILNGNLGIYKGAIYENIIADIFTKLGKKLYYFEYNSRFEIDFFTKYNGHVTAIEVKSGENTKSKSLNTVIDNWNVQEGIKFSMKNIGTSKERRITNYPIYMSIFLK